VKRLFPVLAIILRWGISHSNAAEPPSNAAIMDIFVNTNFRQLNRFEQLPKEVRQNLAMHLVGRATGTGTVVANPDERFNATDIVDPKYPMRRLMFAGEAPRAWFVYYEHAGHYHLIIYWAGRVEPVFAGRFVTEFRDGSLENPPSTIVQLKERFEAGRVEDDAIENLDW